MKFERKVQCTNCTEEQRNQEEMEYKKCPYCNEGAIYNKKNELRPC